MLQAVLAKRELPEVLAERPRADGFAAEVKPAESMPAPTQAYKYRPKR